MRRRLEETLEECLAALEAGQKTVEECLALHPELAARLEPLLHTASRLQKAYDVRPSPAYEQAARQRFLAALAYRRQRRLVARPARPLWRWAPAALGTAAVLALTAWAGVLALGGPGGGSPQVPMAVEEISPTISPVPPEINIQEQVEKVEAHLEEIRSSVEEQGTVEPVAIQQLKNETAALVASLDRPEMLKLEDAPRVDEVLAKQEQILTEVKDKVPPEATDDLDETITIAGVGRTKLEPLLSPTPTPSPEASPSATPAATPTPAPTESPAPTATPQTTPPPSTPTPQPTSGVTPEAGGPASPTATAPP